MQILEWHTQLQQELNKINSSLYDVLLPQEIDMAFNKNIEMFINQRYSPKSNKKQEGFEQSQKRIDDLRSLVTVYKSTAILGSTFINSFDYDSRALLLLPQDYRFKVATRIKESYDSCGKDIAPETSDIAYNLYTLDLSTITDYGAFGIRLSGTDLFTVNSGLSTYTISDFNIFKDIVLDEINSTRVTGLKDTKPAYFETFFTNTYKNKLIIVSTSSLTLTYTINNWTASIAFPAALRITETKYADQFDQNITSDKMATHDSVFALQADPFNNTTPDFPLSFFEGNYYYALYDKNKFVVNEIEMTYIRKPKTVSYYGNISCDLSEHTHQEIISLTADYFLEEFEAGRLQTHKQTVLTTE